MTKTDEELLVCISCDDKKTDDKILVRHMMTKTYNKPLVYMSCVM